MTAIAYRAGIIAADSAFWGGSNCNTIVGHQQKITRLQDGGLIAGCGRRTDLDKARLHLVQSGDLTGLEPFEDLGFNLIWAKPDRTVWWVENDLYPIEVTIPFSACGAPTVFMLGALYAGATAEEAVQLAIRHTDGAAGQVQVERIG